MKNFWTYLTIATILFYSYSPAFAEGAPAPKEDINISVENDNAKNSIDSTLRSLSGQSCNISCDHGTYSASCSGEQHCDCSCSRTPVCQCR